MVDNLLAALSPVQSDALRLGALSHWLDPGLARALYGDEAPARLADLRRFRFVVENRAGQLTYHRQVRDYLLTLWQRDAPDRFRRLSATLAREFAHRLSLPEARAESLAPEWLYHLLPAAPATGLARLAQLFEPAVEAHELGFAERLAAHAQAQSAWLGDEAAWLDYFSARLALARFDPAAAEKLGALARAHAGSALGASAARAAGQANALQRRWARGQDELWGALNTFQRLGSAANVALSHLALGDLYRHLAESSGGILEEEYRIASAFHQLYYWATRGPFLLYRWLAERVEFLPNLFGSNYQNWVVLRLLTRARRHYQRAHRAYARLGDERGVIETQDRLATTFLRQGYPRHAEALIAAALREPVVQASTYRTARARMRLGQVALARGQIRRAAEALSASREVLERFEDWPLAAEAALSLGQALEAGRDWSGAVGAYTRGLDAARRGRDALRLRQTEIARRLRGIASRVEVTDRQIVEASRSALQTVAETAFIARFPGAMQQTFQGFASWLALPFAVFAALMLVAAIGISMNIVEGELFLRLDPVSFLDGVQLLVGVLLPLLAIWGYQLAYRVLGLGFVRFLLPLTRVEESQLDVFTLSPEGIAHVGGDGREVRLKWEEVEAVVADDRCLFHTPMSLFSRLTLLSRETRIVIPATTHYYRDVQLLIELNLKVLGQAPRWVKTGFSILRSRWFWLSAGLALTLGAAVMFAPLLLGGSPLYTCYGGALPCPLENRLYGTTLMVIAMGLFVVIFSAGTAVRWWRANRQAARAREGVKNQDQTPRAPAAAASG
jgi:hypothetical protein